MTDILRFAAFTTDPSGGNPAGIVLDASAMSDADMQRVAAEVGYAETAFVVRPPTDAEPSVGIRYFSPTAEVPFCGHATIATAVALAERAPGGPATDRAFHFDTVAGEVRITTATDGDGRTVAAFRSVEPHVEQLDQAVLERLLGLLELPEGAVLGLADLDPAYPPRLASAGNPHPVVVLADPDVFDHATFDATAMRALMDEQGWTGTVTLLHPLGMADDGVVEFAARNPFPVGTMDEDPATGSAAAAVGGWLRAEHLIEPPARVRIHQGRHVGRPSVLVVDVPERGGILVTGTAVEIPGAPLGDETAD